MKEVLATINTYVNFFDTGCNKNRLAWNRTCINTRTTGKPLVKTRKIPRCWRRTVNHEKKNTVTVDKYDDPTHLDQPLHFKIAKT